MGDGAASRDLRVAVVGAGPSGLYAAEALVSQAPGTRVDVIDRLPVPFGLVRYGVAPDHVTLRGVRHTLEHVLEHEEVRFLGGVEVGRDVTLDELRARYDAVVLAYGAATDRRLGVPGEDLPGSIAATDLVAWYTGHPDADRERVEAALRGARSVVVVGVGNVAVDVTRVLAKAPWELDFTDMPQHVLETLAASSVQEVHVLGRRDAVHATWTTKELRELGELALVDVVVDPEQVELPAPAERHAARNLEVLQSFAARVPEGRQRRIALHFRSRPREILGQDRVESVVVVRTEVDEAGSAVDTDATYEIPAQLVVRSVGYRGVAIDGAPYDELRGVIPSEAGRVLDPDGAAVPGLYVAGWIKRGPTGIVGTNKKDAIESVSSLLADAGEPREAAEADLVALLAERGVDVVTHTGWQAVDRAESALGATRGRERTTIHDRADLLAAARTP